MSANLLKHQAMGFYNSPVGIAHHSAKTSRVLISACRFLMIYLIGAVVGGIWLSRCCFAVFAITYQLLNTFFSAFMSEIWKACSSWFDCQYAFLRSIITHCGSSELAFKRLPSWPIWSKKWLRKLIITKWNSGSSTRCCAISDSICIISSSMWWLFAAAKRFFQAWSLSCSFYLSIIRHISKLLWPSL